MRNVRLFVMVFAAVLACANVTFAESRKPSEISYKGTKFGVSEKLFSQRHANEGFVCATAPTKVGRWCTSEVSTYGNLKAKTIAQFIDDRLIGVSIFFIDPPDVATGVLNDVLIVSQLEKLYGLPDEIRWPEESPNGVTIWKKVWNKRDGSSATYLHQRTTGADLQLETRSVFLLSKDADQLSRKAYNSKKPDM